MKQSCIVDSTMKVEYVVTSKVVKEVIWIMKFLIELGVVSLGMSFMILFDDNNEVMEQSKELRNHQKSQHIESSSI